MSPQLNLPVRSEPFLSSKVIVAACLVIAGFASLVPAAGAQAQVPPVSIAKVTDNVYVTQGGAGSNMGIIIGDKGVIIIDAKISADSAKEGLAAIAKLTSKPITTVIITHSDLDHVNGLVSFPKGLTIIAQENCKKEMEASLSTPRPAPREYLPTHTVNKKENLTIDGVRLELRHWAPAHTSGDLTIFLPKEKVVFTGDLINPTQPYTGIHLEKNGSTAGWAKNVKGMLAFKADTYVPGHGVVQTHTEVAARFAKVEAQRDKIKAMIAQGKSLPEIKAALGEATPPPPTAPGAPPPVTFTDVVYKEFAPKG